MLQTAFGMTPTEADVAQVVLAPSRVIVLSTPTTHPQNPRETADPAGHSSGSRNGWNCTFAPHDGDPRDRPLRTGGEVETHAAFGPQHRHVKLYRLMIQSPMSPPPHRPAEIRRKIGGDMVGARTQSPLRDLQRDQPAAFPHPRAVHLVCP